MLNEKPAEYTVPPVLQENLDPLFYDIFKNNFMLTFY